MTTEQLLEDNARFFKLWDDTQKSLNKLESHCIATREQFSELTREEKLKLQLDNI